MLTLLERGLVMVHLDARHASVRVPEHLKDDAGLRLNIAYGFNLPALEIGEDGIYAVLSFNRQPCPCELPWEAVFAFTLPSEGHWGVMWPLSVPVEHRASLVDGDVPMDWRPVAFGANAPTDAGAGKARPSHLRVVEEDDAVPAQPAPMAVSPAPEPAAIEASEDVPPPGKGRPTLRLVKG
jgi:stringent starvation protein B